MDGGGGGGKGGGRLGGGSNPFVGYGHCLVNADGDDDSAGS